VASRSLKFAVSNGRGIEKIIYFEGLEHEMIIHPTIHGEPILTSQAFYYLKNLDSVALLKFDISAPQLSDDQVEYLIDNYLFEYSTINLTSRMTTKISEVVFWKDDYNEIYHHYDQANTGALILDEGNDPTVISVEPIDENVGLGDWCIPKNYTAPIIESYVDQMHELLFKKVMIQVMPNEHRDGYFGKKRIFELGEGLLDLHQAERLDWLRNLDKNADYHTLSSSYGSELDVDLPIEKVTCTKLYNPLLLSYYFSGLNDKKPLGSFVGYYNVLEYYFEEAPTLLNINARVERDQLKAVVQYLVCEADIKAYIANLPQAEVAELSKDITTSSSVVIDALKVNSSDLTAELTRWLYELRCAIVHSKKTRRGKNVAIFEPYSKEANRVKIALPIVRWLAIHCIRKDYTLGNGRQNL